MSLKTSGVRLVAEDEANFYRSLERSNLAVVEFGRQAERSAHGVDSLGDSAADTARALDRADHAFDTTADAADHAARSTSLFDETITGAARHVGTLVVDNLLEAGAAILDFGRDTLAAGGDYEATLNRFASVAGDAVADAGMEIADFNALALEMGAQTQYSAGEAADAMVDLAKGGLDPATIAADGLEGALSLAAAGEIELAESANITAKQLGIWADQGVDATDVANLLAQAANASTVDVDELALGLANSGLSAKNAGLDYRELTQTMALLAPGFSSAADAGTSFATLISNLTPKTENASDAFRTLNLLTEDGKSKFFDLNGQFVGMEMAAQLLADATAGLSEEQRIMALNAAFGSDAIRAAALIAQNGAQGYRDMGTAMDGAGTAAAQAAKRNQGLNFALESLRGTFETIQIVVASAVIPTLTTLIQDVIIPGANRVLAFAQAVAEADDPMRALVEGIDGVVPGFALLVTLGGTATDLIADNLTPAIYGLSTATTVYAVGSLPKMITGLAAATRALIAHGVAATAALGPLGILAAGAGLAVAGLVKTHEDGEARIRDMTRAVQDEVEVLQEAQRVLDELQATEAGATKGTAANVAELERLKQAHAAVTAKVVEYNFALDMADPAARAKALAPYVAQQRDLESQIGRVTARMQMQVDAQTRLDAGVAESSGGWSVYNSMLDGGIERTKDYARAADDAAAAAEDQAAAVKDAHERLQEIMLGGEGASGLREVVDATLAYQDEVEQAATEHWANLADLHKEWADATTADERAAIQERINAEQSGYATSQQNAAAAFAEQQAANRANLGILLIDTVNAWQTLGQVPADAADAIRSGIAEHFGVAGDTMSLQFGRFLGVIQGVADGTGVAVEDMGTAFGALERSATASAAGTAKSQELMIADIVAQYNAGLISWEEYTAALAQTPTEVNTLVTSNVPEQVAYWQQLGEKQGAISPVTAAQIDSNVVDARERFIDFKLAQAEIRADIPAHVTDNADEVRGRYLILEAKRAAMALSKPAVNIDTNADAVTQQINNVGAAVRNLPTSKTIRIEADIDPMLVQHSPSPIENVMAAIADFARKQHTIDLQLRSDIVIGGYPAARPKSAEDAIVAIRELLESGDFKGGFGFHEDDPFSNWLLTMSKDADNTAAVLRVLNGEMFGIATSAGMGEFVTDGHPFVELLRQLAGHSADAFVGGFDDKKPMEQITRKVRTMLGKEIPDDAIPYAGKLGGDLGATMAEHFGREAGQMAERVKTMLGQTIPADAVPYAGVLGELIGGAIADGATKKLKTMLGQGIPGAVAEVSKALQSDKNRSDEAKAGKMGKLGGEGAFARQGEGWFGTEIAESAGAAAEEASTTFTGLLAGTLEATKPVTVSKMATTMRDIHHQVVQDWAPKVNEWHLIEGGWMMHYLAEGVSGSRAPVDAALSMGQAIAAALLEGYGTPVLPAPIIGSSMTQDRVSPPASPGQLRQASISSVSNSFAWSGNLVLPPGTPQAHGDALIDYLQSRGA